LSPEEIKEENAKRRKLKKDFGVKSRSKVTRIIDPNAPKRPTTPYIYFIKEQTRTPGAKSVDFVKDCAQKWRALSQDDKRVPHDLKNQANLDIRSERTAG
jgi:HMG (high mobility group) box